MGKASDFLTLCTKLHAILALENDWTSQLILKLAFYHHIQLWKHDFPITKYGLLFLCWSPNSPKLLYEPRDFLLVFVARVWIWAWINLWVFQTCWGYGDPAYPNSSWSSEVFVGRVRKFIHRAQSLCYLGCLQWHNLTVQAKNCRTCLVCTHKHTADYGEFDWRLFIFRVLIHQHLTNFLNYVLMTWCSWI